MKQRIITGAIMTLFVAPLIVFGGYFMFAFIVLLLGIGIYEFLHIKKKSGKEGIPFYVYIICFIFAYMIVFSIPLNGFDSFDYKTATLTGSWNLSPIIFMLFLFFTTSIPVFDKDVSPLDSFYAFGTTIYLSFGLKGLLYLRSFSGNGAENTNLGLMVVAFLLIVTCFTDIFAYFGGMLCYKLLGENRVHKLNVRISPKKTIEGTIVGTLFGTICGMLFGFLVVNRFGFTFEWYMYLLFSFVLSLAGQMGDLMLSAIKRLFNVKDYSNLLPGHGGALDRIDSLLATSILMSVLLFLFL